MKNISEKQIKELAEKFDKLKSDFEAILKESQEPELIKPKQIEKIQGFEVREYPDMPLVEVSDNGDFDGKYIGRLLEVKNKNNHFPFNIDDNTNGGKWKFCRPVPQEKRNFFDFENGEQS